MSFEKIYLVLRKWRGAYLGVFMLKYWEALYFDGLLMLHEPWNPPTSRLSWLHVSSHSLIALFYYSISILLVCFLRQRPNLPFARILMLLGAFTLASGTTHLMEAGSLWHPTSWWLEGIEANTVVIALFAVLLTVLSLPKVLELVIGDWGLGRAGKAGETREAGEPGEAGEAREVGEVEEKLSSCGTFPRTTPLSQSPVPNSLEIQGRVRWLEELGLLQSLSALISEAPDFDSALRVALRLVCEVTHWDYGEAWLPRPDNSVLECSSAWHGNTTTLTEFRLWREKLAFPPNSGLPGRVWSSRRPEWIEDISDERGMMNDEQGNNSSFCIHHSSSLKCCDSVMRSDSDSVSDSEALATQGASEQASAYTATGNAMLFDHATTLRLLQRSTQTLRATQGASAGGNSVPRPLATVAGFKAGFAVPILMGDRVLAVLTFFITQFRAEDKQLVELVSAVATQLGLVMQRKQLEEELRQEKDFSKTLIETSSAFFVAVDHKGRMIMMNQEFLKAAGYTLDEVSGTEYLSTFTRQGDRKALYKTFKQLVKRKQSILKENYVLTKDGRELLVEWRGKPIFKNNGELDFFFGVGIDITERKRLEEELRKSEERYRAVVEDQSELICRFVADGTITFVNDAYCRYFGKTREELLGSSLFQMIPDEYREKTKRHIANLSLKNPAATREYQIFKPDGKIHWLQCTDRVIVDKRNDERGNNSSFITQHSSFPIVEFQSVGRDITERRRSEQEAAWLASIALLSPNPIVETDLVGQVRYLNPEAMRLLPDLQDLGCKHPFLAGIPSMAAVLQRQGSLRREIEIGEVYFEQVLHYLEQIECLRIYAFDISDRKRAEEQIIHNAFYDQLTGLPNRALLMDRLRQAVQRAKQYRSGNSPNQPCLFAVLFLNLNRFKLVNDSLGNQIGDQLLQNVAHRLTSCLHPTDTLARLGGDEFAIIIEGIGGVDDAIQVAESIHQTFASPFYLNESEVFVTLSIGIALSTGSDDQPEHLLRNADLAMYRARSQATSCYEVFDATMHQLAVDRLQIETDLRRAIERQEFRVHYQPIVSLSTGRIIGFEALLRWQHPSRGLVSPIEFIPTAEETGLITPIGWWTLREACRQLKIWQEQFASPQPLTMNVNLSCKQFTQPDLLEQIDSVLGETQPAIGSLKLEITESVVMENPDLVRELLLQLQKRKIPLCIDDFGTGYSSLSRLHHFPISTLKIDRSFVSRLGALGENSEIIRAIVTLAQNLSMDVVAEGIEVSEQILPLIELRCEYGQGYFFSKPLDSEGAKALLIAQWRQRIDTPTS